MNHWSIVLGLKNPGAQASQLLSDICIEKRNEYLAEALALLETQGEKSPAKQLAIEVIRFNRRVLPRLQFQDRRPELLSELDMLLFRAFDTGLKMPETAHGLRKAAGNCLTYSALPGSVRGLDTTEEIVKVVKT